jgi:sugar lactone lactonase YvrE
MKITRLASLLVLAIAATPAGCKKKEEQTSETPPPVAADASTTAKAADAAAGAGPRRIADVGFATPESVLHDFANDVYYVSNINGAPGAVDGNGFISKLSPDGSVTALKWIDGEAEGVTLNAPKGMTIAKDTLYVADIDHVRMFDIATGKAKGEIAVKGATFLNDLTQMAGVVYASDSGIEISEEGVKPTGTDAIYSIDGDGNVTKMAEGEALNRPNGLHYADALHMVTFGSNQLHRVAKSGKTEVIAELPKGGLDGLVVLDDERVLVSSWECQCIYAGPPKGPFEPAISDVKAPADFGWDSRRKRVLVPLFEDDAVVFYDQP